MPDELWGEIVTAMVVMDDGVVSPSVDELRQHVAGLAS